MPAKKKSASSADAQKRRKKAVAKKAPAKKVKKTTPKAKKVKEKLLGKVDHYFDKINVAAMKLEDSLKVGDTIRVEGGSVAFTQQVASMQIEHEPVTAAKKGDEVGFKVKQKVREGYRVYKV
jgi:translation elongation factor EF-1alpha